MLVSVQNTHFNLIRMITEYFPCNLVHLAIAVSRDHKPDQTDERQRIEDAGGFVMWAGKVMQIDIFINLN